MKHLYYLSLFFSTFLIYGQNIVVTVDASQESLSPGINIVHNFGGWVETSTTDNGDGTFSYTFSNVSSGTTIEYIWKAYYSDGSSTQENFGTAQILGNGQYENYLLSDIPSNETIITDYFSYGNRTVTSDGNSYTAQTYYFHSIRRPGVNYPELTLTAGSSGGTATIRSSLDWTRPGAGGRDNGDGTYTAIVLPTSSFEYMWTYNSTEENLTSCTGDLTIVNTDGSSYANRVHNAGESRSDTFNTCPAGTLSIESSQLGTLNIFPNPFVDVVNISAATSIDQVRVFDLVGRMVKQATPSSNDFSIDVADLNKGVYMVQLKAGNKETTLKIVK